MREDSNERKEIRTVFEMFDTDGSGDISADELGDVMTTLGLDPTDEEVDLIIRRVDLDGSGTISFSEFCRILDDFSSGGSPRSEPMLSDQAIRQAHPQPQSTEYKRCLLYTSDAADEEDSVDLGGRRIIKKKKNKEIKICRVYKYRKMK
eukprot:TRINITY_DN49644_c0_g1_i1.p1 TRINITY_DN49644_c0_g1~~TRINITY_DN49644_c0_g1_i1.p1  ORF type:complete len:149 (+),score=38.80 TRINITY_DN49644_c0_g1_i1:204-650(+)